MTSRFLSLAAITAFASACGADTDNDEYSEVDTTAAIGVASELEEPFPVLSSDDFLRVCRVGHGHSVGRDPSEMDASLRDREMVRLTYTRDDGKSFRYDCIVEGNTVRTRMIDEGGPGTGPGSWSGRGSRLTFEMNGNSIEVREVFFDGSSDIGIYEF